MGATLVVVLCILQQTAYEPFDNSHLYICLGDSVINNEKYVLPGESVISYLSKSLHIYNLSQDNARINDIPYQLAEIDPDQLKYENISVILSIGGNNLLNMEDVDEVFIKYTHLVKTILSKYIKGNGLLYLLNLYYPVDPSIHLFYPIISKWNKYLSKLDTYPKIRVIDLSNLLIDSEDFTHVIEPSEIGGSKIVTAITHSI